MLLLWISFILFVLLLLALDLGVFHRSAHVVSVREALAWSGVWIGLALLFSVFVYFGYERGWMGLGASIDPVDNLQNDGSRAVTKYLTGYVIEKSLSVDNIFVIAMLFAFFAVPAKDQHRLLFWGILGALVMRGVMIGVGATLIARFNWILYVFGVLLLLTAVKMLLMKHDEIDPNKNTIVRVIQKLLPGVGPSVLALVTIEATDLVFAVDSIPAIFAITGDAFLVFTSNIFAILGLRSLYFALAGAMKSFKYLKPALAIVLAIVGAKMLSHHWLKSILGDRFNFYLLGVVLLVLLAGVLASLIASHRNSQKMKPASAV